MISNQIRTRIKLSVAAYAYEICDDPIMSDAEFDALARQVHPMIATGHVVMDFFFRTIFDPSTGVWIRAHPQLDRIADLYRRYYRGK